MAQAHQSGASEFSYPFCRCEIVYYRMVLCSGADGGWGTEGWLIFYNVTFFKILKATHNSEVICYWVKNLERKAVVY